MPLDALAAQEAAPTEAQRFDIGAIDVTGNSLLSDAEIERAIYSFSGPRRTAADVEAARAALEKAYRDKGYDSVVVEIPQQSASVGVIRLVVTESKIAHVEVTGVGKGTARTVRGRVPSLTEGAVPNLTIAQAELAEANRLPEQQVTPLLKPGKAPGTIDVELKVDDKHPLHGSLQLSNDRSPNTEPLRLLASLRYDNLWGLGHTISGTYVVAPEDRSNAEVFAGSYLAPIWGSPFSVLVYGYTSNSSVAALGGSNVLGNGYAIGVRGILKLPSRGAFAQSLSFGPDYKDFREQVVLAGSDTPIRTPLRYVPLNASYSASLSGEKDTASVSVAVTAGFRPLSIGRIDVDGQLVDAFQVKRGSFGARSNFVHVNVDADYTHTFPKDFLGNIRLSAQAADGPLVSNEQFAAGGLSSVRGYLQSEAIGDNGVAGAIELRSPSFASRLGDFVDETRLYAFTDAAYASVIDAAPGQVGSFTLWSAGLGLQARLFKYLSGDIFVAFPIEDGLRNRRTFTGFTVKADY